MSIDEAIKVLNMVEAHGLADDAKKTAIRSLEAWEKVKEDIHKSVSMTENSGVRDGYAISLIIIDKHLEEATRDGET